MTKQLPVIYVHFESDGTFVSSSPRKEWAEISRQQPGNEGDSYVEYVPRESLSPPTCNTCSYWSRRHPTSMEIVCNNPNGALRTPDDGSGYCHLHSEKKASDNG